MARMVVGVLLFACAAAVVYVATRSSQRTPSLSLRAVNRPARDDFAEPAATSWYGKSTRFES